MRVALKTRVLSGCAALAVAAMIAGCATPAPAPVADAAPKAVAAVPGKIDIKVLSSRYDLVTGGDALVEIRASEGARADQLETNINGRDVSGLKYDAASNSLRGVVTGLDDGANWLQVYSAGVPTSQSLVNHPITGPVLAGPLMAPYECRTVESGLGEPTDRNCSAPTRYDWFYKSRDGGFKPLDKPKIQPDDLAMTTTIEGKTVPYIVRVESGVIDRSIYRMAVLDDPSTSAFGANEGWNGRLAFTFGGGAGTQYNQGVNQVTSVLSDLYLSRGFAYVNSTELVNQQHGNAVLQGEDLMMLKEHFIEAYGVPKWTVGTGGSGGAIQQLVITQIYPGLLDGLQPSLAFPDSTLHTGDCGLLERYWTTPDGKKLSKDKRTAIEGFFGGTCASWARSFVPVLDATNKKGCMLNDASLIYDPKTNPTGARCTLTDMRVNIYGRDPKTGFARKPDDNVGVEYGLKALNDKVISVDEFLALNEKIGGNDVDGQFVKQRSVGDPVALKAVYASGLMNSGGGGLANVPILDYRWYTDSVSDIHSRERDLVIRARLERANGRSDNQVIWVAGPENRPARPGAAPAPGTTPVDLSVLALDAMTKWLDAMAADPAPLSTDKVVKHKPAEATDAYWTVDGKKMAAKADWDASSAFNQAFPLHLEPRLVAGSPIVDDIMKCQLKPVDFSAYAVQFTRAQQKRMKKIFPDGVCDWSKPGVGQGKITGTYQRY
jgi:hypothetical protein